MDTAPFPLFLNPAHRRPRESGIDLPQVWRFGAIRFQGNNELTRAIDEAGTSTLDDRGTSCFVKSSEVHLYLFCAGLLTGYLRVMRIPLRFNHDLAAAVNVSPMPIHHHGRHSLCVKRRDHL